MLTTLKFTHLLLPLIIAFTFIYLQIELIDNLIYLVTDIAVFILLFMFYGVATYLVLHTAPGYEDSLNSSRLGIENLFEYKKNDERRTAIEQELRKGDNTVNMRQSLEEQLISLMTQNSFCDLCQTVKSPRSHHCFECGQCILRNEYHCKYLNTCIGENNYKIYIQYLLALILTTFCIFSSCIASTLIYQNNVNKWSIKRGSVFALLFAICAFVFMVAIILFLYSLRNLKNNVTHLQLRVKSFVQKNPFHEDYYHKLFPSLASFFDLNYRSQVLVQQLVTETSTQLE